MLIFEDVFTLTGRVEGVDGPVYILNMLRRKRKNDLKINCIRKYVKLKKVNI